MSLQSSRIIDPWKIWLVLSGLAFALVLFSSFKIYKESSLSNQQILAAQLNTLLQVESSAMEAGHYRHMAENIGGAFSNTFGSIVVAGVTYGFGLKIRDSECLSKTLTNPFQAGEIIDIRICRPSAFPIWQLAQQLLMFLAFAGAALMYLLRYETNVFSSIAEIFKRAGVKISKQAGISGIANQVQELGHQVATYQTKLIESEKEAAVGRIVSHISHDLKGPLGTIAVTTRQLADKLKTEDQNAISMSINRLYSMIDALSKTDMEQMVSSRWQSWDIANFFTELQTLGKAHNKIIVVERIPGALASVRVDLPKIERAIINLVMNGIEASVEQVAVSCEVDQTTLIFKISDDGPGVASEIEDRLFQRGATWAKAGGSGLGLCFAAQVARGHSGDISYGRAHNRTTFIITLPYAVSDLNQIPVDEIAVKIPEPIAVSRVYRTIRIVIEDFEQLSTRVTDLANELGIPVSGVDNFKIDTILDDELVITDDFTTYIELTQVGKQARHVASVNDDQLLKRLKRIDEGRTSAKYS